jgi:signal transduction histidine kinase/CheY-like chemotaxis protein
MIQNDRLSLLRERAEQALQNGEILLSNLSHQEVFNDIGKVIEELAIYRAELELQNAELVISQLQTKKALSQYQLLFQSLPMAACILNKSGVIVQANTQAVNIFGFLSISKLENHSFYRLIEETDRVRVGQVLFEKNRTGSVNIIPNIKPNDNSIGNFSILDGHFIHLSKDYHLEDHTLVLLVDRSVEQVHDYEKSLYQAIIDNSPSIMLAFDIQGQCLVANKATLKYTKFNDLNEIVGSQAEDICVNLKNALDFSQNLNEVLTTKQHFVNEETVIVDNHKEHFITNSFPLKDENGVFGAGVIKTNTTEIKEAEIQLQSALLKAKEEAEVLARAKTEFIANMSHEIRTPMNGIMGFSELALTENFNDEEAHYYFSQIHNSAKHLIRILNKILDLSKLEVNKTEIENLLFSPTQLVEETKNLFELSFKQKELKFNIMMDTNMPNFVKGDKFRIQQILSNLIGNAIKFTKQGSITLKIELLEYHLSNVILRFNVIDTGIGISQKAQKKLFQPFIQADNSTTRKYGGTGLGLAISQKLLVLMNSQCHLKSEVGKGSTFYFDLTFETENCTLTKNDSLFNVTEEPLSLESKEPQKESENETLQNICVLVAEDDEVNQIVIQKFLERLGIEVDVASDGLEVLALLEHKTYDAILMDIHMPNMDGLEVTKKIRQQKQYEKLPIIAVSAGISVKEKFTCLECGMNDFVEKPITPESLMRTLTRNIKYYQSFLEKEKEKPISTPSENVLVLDGFNFKNVLSMLNGDEKKLIQLLKHFSVKFSNVVSEIHQFINQHQTKELKAFVHLLKGSSANIGAIVLYQASSKLYEHIDTNQELDLQIWLNFVNSLNYTLEAIKNLPESDVSSSKLFSEVVEEISVALLNHGFVHDDLLSQFKAYLSEEQMTLYEKMLTNIYNVKYVDAQNYLKILEKEYHENN